ncbi:tRNA epoxyqueuosine(34) reductase QueG [Aquisalinus luteolus]|uniref:Epoxyqueuosine reductase n=1 Tax=Aquisalinus luteolus TaxID=1566827 RepID=A0A8J3A4A0_9PROT|nr:tRNA epoxyqueuosine(34) reductase QueG [Aquisalinus luteolus]GGI01886.1 epoxyqueuosine reductase [Aquisalinus luteolus]
MTTSQHIREEIRARALEEGFDVAGFTTARLPDSAGEGLAAFLANGHHGDMDWLETRREQRASPDALWPEARSVIALGLNYGPDEDPMEKLARRLEGNISVYAGNKDYHDVIKKRLKRIGRWVCEAHDCSVKVFVDTAPVMEKPLGQQAGIGWQGKHTNLVSREFGSWLFLGAIYMTLDLPPDDPEADHCGSCRACLDICPTKAFPAPYQIDARRCISYLTIENKGHIPLEFRAAMGNRIYGCDDCTAVCPWNKFATRTEEVAFHTREALRGPLLAELSALDDNAFREMFRASPVKRIGRDRFVRNVLIAIGNSGEQALAANAQALLADPSPLVRSMAIWALSKLDRAAAGRAREQYATMETDDAVKAEWQRIAQPADQ